MHYSIICDFRENLNSVFIDEENKQLYSDHPAKRNIIEIISCMTELGYDCSYWGGIPELISSVNMGQSFPDSIFLNLTDGMNQDYSRAQAPVLLDILGVQYSGSGVFASVLMNNKFFCKRSLQTLGVNMAKSCLINDVIPFNEILVQGWKYPLFIKPNCEGSSMGISDKNVCHNIEDIRSNIKRLLPEYHELILEEFVRGIDVTSYLVGNEDQYPINDVITIKLDNPSNYAIFGPKEKFLKLRTLYYNDEYLPPRIVHMIQEQTIKIAKFIGVKDICRIDYRYDAITQKMYFIEINSAPRFSSTSEIGFIAQKRGLSFKNMVQIYVDVINKRVGL